MPEDSQMTPNHQTQEDSWYFAHNDQEHGPVAFAALQQMAERQELAQGDLVWQVGSAGWVPASQIPGLCMVAGWDAQVPSLPQAPRASLQDQMQPHLQDLRSRVGELDQTENALQALPHLRFLNGLLISMSRQITVHQLDSADRSMKRLGSLAYMLAAVLYATFFAVMSLRADSIQQFLGTLLIVVPGATICHFIAIHFIESSESMLGQTPTELSSKTLATSLGLLAAAAGMLILALASHDLFRKIAIAESLVAIAIAVALLYAAGACFNPAGLNMSVEARAPGAREAIGILMMLAKLLLRLIPVTFGLVALLAAGSALFFCHQLINGEGLELRYAQALEVAPKALLLGLLPMAVYLLSVLAILLIDSFRAPLDTADGIQTLASLPTERQPASSS